VSLRQRMKFAVKAVMNVHRSAGLPDIFLFATPRGGSTWAMEILASQPGVKFFDEPLSPRRENVRYGGWIPDYESLMPETGDPERILGFLRDLQAGRHGYMNVTPFRRNYRPLTNRALFKIHEIEHLMHAVTTRCNAAVVYLLRHPIATSVSRSLLPRLDLFLRSAFYAEIIGNPAQLTEIRSLATGGSQMQRAVVSWCYENLIPLRSPSPEWLVVTYEELVLNPEQSCDLLLRRLQFLDRDAMLAAFERPAVNIRMSHTQTLDAMKSEDASERRRRLVKKWLERVTPRQVAEAQAVLDAFGLDAYRAEAALARRSLLHFEDTPERLESTPRG